MIRVKISKVFLSEIHVSETTVPRLNTWTGQKMVVIKTMAQFLKLIPHKDHHNFSHER